MQVPLIRMQGLGHGIMHGGRMRSLQLQELLLNCGVEAVEIAAGDWPTERRLGHLMRGAQLLCSKRVGGFFSKDAGRCICKGGLLYKRLRQQTSEICFLESTGFPFAWHAATRAGFSRIVAFPQNLESLQSARSDWRSLAEEMCGGLARADYVWTISSEEAWLCSQYGLHHVGWLPYWPPSYVMERCKQRRFARHAAGEGEGVLYLGTRQAITDSGVRQLMMYAEKAGMPLTVCGFGTETYREFGVLEHVRVLGTVSEADLERELVAASCIIVWNERGAGALTRIPEMILSGIPVVCNINAARSAWLWRGVLPVQRLDDLPQAIRSCRNMRLDGELPDSIQSLRQQFCAWLSDLMSAR